MEILFWLFLFIIFYSYLGYGVLLYALILLRRVVKGKRPVPAYDEWPAVTLMIAAYNEAEFLPAKAQNCLDLDYPADKLKIVFVTDGSNDGSEELLKAYPRITVLHKPERAGKINAMNRGMQFVDTPVTIFCDANTRLNREAIKNITRHFADANVGCVAGEKRIETGDAANASGAGEGIYWKYESLLKKWDSELGSVVGAAGELFSIRTSLFKPVEADTLLDDFMISMRVAGEGYRVVYEPEALAFENPTANVGEEMKRKVRICAGGIQSIIRLAPLLNPFKYGKLTFQYVSHRVLRWSLTPLLLLLIIPINIYLALDKGGIYMFLLWCQALFYVVSLLGMYLQSKEIKVKVLFVPYFFFIMNLAVYLGLRRYLRGSQSVLWEKAKRA